MKIYLVITNRVRNLSKEIDVTEYSIFQFEKTANIYAENFDVKVRSTR